MVFKTSILRISTVYIDGAIYSKMSAPVAFDKTHSFHRNGILHCVFNKSLGLNWPTLNSVEVFIIAWSIWIARIVMAQSNLMTKHMGTLNAHCVSWNSSLESLRFNRFNQIILSNTLTIIKQRKVF